MQFQCGLGAVPDRFAFIIIIIIIIMLRKLDQTSYQLFVYVAAIQCHSSLMLNNHQSSSGEQLQGGFRQLIYSFFKKYLSIYYSLKIIN